MNGRRRRLPARSRWQPVGHGVTSRRVVSVERLSENTGCPPEAIATAQS